MSSRHRLPWWRYGAAVSGMALAPVIGALALALTVIGLFAAAVGVVNRLEPIVLTAGVGAAVLGLGMGWLFLSAWGARKMLLRAQRMALGVLVILVGCIAWALAPHATQVGTGMVAGAGAYIAYGLLVIVDAQRDRWSA